MVWDVHTLRQARTHQGLYNLAFFLLAAGFLGVPASIRAQSAFESRWSAELTSNANETAWGDINGDGRLDLVAGPQLFLNQDGQLATVPAWQSSISQTNWGLALGDLDGDGDLDLVMASALLPTYAGLIYLNNGGLFAPDTSWSFRSDYFLTDVALGDVDLDGDLDIVFSTYRSKLLFQNNAGSITRTPVWSSQEIEETRGIALGDIDNDGDLDLVSANLRTEPIDYLRSACSAGDLNGDSYGDWLVGLPGTANCACTNSGRVAILLGGAAVDSVPDLSLRGEADQDGFGTTIAAAGDVNGDGYDDVIVGAPLNDSGGTNAGRAYLYYGGAVLDSIPDVIFTGRAPGDGYGYVSGAGDFNGDGFADLIVGAPNSNLGVVHGGSAYIYYGGVAPDNVPDVTLKNYSASFGNYGYSVSAAGDVNGDGFEDVIVAGRYIWPSGGDLNSMADIYFGGPNPDSVSDLMLTGAPTDYLSWSVSEAGDVNGDGFGDVIVGAYLNDVGGTNSGRAYIFFGGPTPDSRPDLTLAGDAGDQLGWSVSAAGDVNGDGFADVVVGAPYNDSGGNDAGRVYVLFGGSTPDTIPDLTFTGHEESGRLGNGVSEAGDVNQDGFDDVLGIDTHEDSDIDVGRAHLYFGGSGPEIEPGVFVTGLVPPGSYTLYRNDFKENGGTFASHASQRVVSRLGFRNVALGDMNGDGTLDLAFARHHGRHSIYLTRAGMPDAEPAWVADSTQSTMTTMALGDLDFDGDLDLVAAETPLDSSVTARVFLNSGGSFNSQADHNLPVGRAISAALGDVDDDGDLDLALAGSTAATGPLQATLYQNNIASLFTAGTSWSSNSIEKSQAVEAADLDADGFNDLVFGNLGKSTVHYGSATGISEEPGWSTLFESDTRDVAVADMNGDRRLDVITANYDTRSAIYSSMSRGATFPDWISEDSFGTNSASPGDLDRDGDIDLALGQTASNLVYLSENGVLPTTTPYMSGSNGKAVVITDIDSSGDLDLVAGNGADQNTACFGGVAGLTDGVDWRSDSGRGTTCLAVGDVNGDGRPDVAFGNESDANTVHLNTGGEGVLSPTPNFRLGVPTEPTTAIGLRDLDGDGDLDLVAANRRGTGRALQLFLNRSGEFSFEPDMAWGTEQDTRGLAVADLDRDGDLDLATANFAGPNTIHSGLRNPLYRGDPHRPTNHQPNTDALIDSIRVVLQSEDHYRLFLKAVDVESDPIWLIPEYHLPSESRWKPLLFEGKSGRIGPVATSPEGVVHDFLWDVTLLPIEIQSLDIRLRWTSNPGRAGLVQHTGMYEYELFPVHIFRPLAAFVDDVLAFSTVTVGDTASADLKVRNRGNKPLQVLGLDFTTSAFSSGGSLPLTVPVGGEASIPIQVAPTEALPETLEVELSSNDPLTPKSRIPITADVRELVVQVRDLVTVERAPLGEALTVLVGPAPQVHVETGQVFYRTSGSPAFAASTPLVPLTSDFIGTIPASAVTEAGVDYYVLVENSGVTRRFPETPTAWYTQLVEQPRSVEAVPQRNSSGGSGFLAGLNLDIFVNLPLGSTFENGTLHYSEGGRGISHSQPIVAGRLFPSAIVPDSLVTARGLEYWIEVNTVSGMTLTDPASHPTQEPRTLRTTVPRLEEPMAYPARQYRIVSIPLDFVTPVSLKEVLADNTGFGPVDPSRWRCFRYRGNEGYEELSNQAHPNDFPAAPGKAYWLISAGEHRIETAPFVGLSTPTDSSFVIQLDPGWNLIGNPFAFDVSGRSAMIDSVPVGDQTLVEPPVGWGADPWGYHYLAGPGSGWDQAILLPFSGYWVMNWSPSPVRLLIPPIEAATELQTSLVGKTAVPEEGSWRIRILASTSASEDEAMAGVAADATLLRDCWDRSDPPQPPDQSISVYFPHDDWPEAPGIYAVDIRPDLKAEEGHVWSFDVSRSSEKVQSDDAIDLRFQFQGLPDGLHAVLLDNDLDRMTDLRSHQEIAFAAGERAVVTRTSDARFELLVGSREFVENRTKERSSEHFQTRLLQNFPNPFRSATLIRYEVGGQEMVNIDIFDVSGRRIRQLVNAVQDPGRYDVVWHGDDRTGVRLSPGIYFCRISTAERVETRKLLLMK